jgi:protein-L-isoaspartate(D-aspartate) O-methyltransferase
MVFAPGILGAALILLGGALVLCGCSRNGPGPSAPPEQPVGEFAAERARMVETQIERRGILDPRVLDAMRAVPRELFVPREERRNAYRDGPLPIGFGQTISQPYVVAFMSEALGVGPGDRVLEVGTGSGYQAAVLAEMGCEVWSIEIVSELAERSSALLEELGLDVNVRAGDGYRGWPEHAPFDAVIVTAAPDHVPPALVEQLVEGGRLVIPVGAYDQDLIRLTKAANGVVSEELLPVRFVPMTGEAQE